MKSKKILHICLFGTYDEAILSNRVILRGISGLDNVKVYTAHVQVPRDVLFSPKHMGFSSLIGRAWNRVKAQIQLIRQAKQVLKSDVIIVLPFGLFDLVQAGIYKLLFKKRIVYVPQNSLYDLLVYAGDERKIFIPIQFLGYHLERFLWCIPDVMIFNSTEEAKQHKELLNLPRLQTAILPLGADDSVFLPQKIKNNTTTTSVLFYGEYNIGHGADFIVKAIHQLRHKPSIQFTMVGDGKMKAQVLALAKRLKVSNVTFLGWVTAAELAEHIKNADIVLGMFRKDPLVSRVVPNKVYQALASKRCVVTSSSPAIREFLRPNEVYMVQPSNAGDLARAIDRLSVDYKTRIQYAQRGYSKFRTSFAPSPVAQTLVRYIEQLLEAKGGIV